MKPKTTIRSSNSGWVVYFDNDVTNFYPFVSIETTRLAEFLIEEVIGVRLDDIVRERMAEIEKGKKS